MDLVIAQGAEAGGHRRSYLRNPYESMTGTFALVRLIVHSVMTPVVAAGGIMDGAGIANRFMREMHERAAPQLVFPAQNTLTGRLRAASAKAGNADFVAMWAGQATPLARELPAAQLVAALEAETLEALDRMVALRG